MSLRFGSALLTTGRSVQATAFRIFAGLRLARLALASAERAEVASATQAGGLPRPSVHSGRNVVDTEERSTFGLIQECCTRVIVYSTKFINLVLYTTLVFQGGRRMPQRCASFRRKAEGEHREAGSRKIYVRKFICDRVPPLAHTMRYRP